MFYLRTFVQNPILSQRLVKMAFHTSGTQSSKIAVVLSGCGVYDGSEIHEASAILVHLSRGGANVSMFAPDIDQMHVVDHTKGEPMEPNRSIGRRIYVIEETTNLCQVHVKHLHMPGGEIPEIFDKVCQSIQAPQMAKDYDAVIFPGGFGAAKNLSTFAVDGANMKVNSDVERVIKDFHSSSKPIGLCCIAPVLAAKVIGNCQVTVGSDQEEGGRWPYAGTAEAIQKLGATHIKKNVTDAHVDEKNRIVTTPAFMCETALHEIFDGIGQMVQNLLKLIK